MTYWSAYAAEGMLVDGPAVLGWSEWRAMNEAAPWLAGSAKPEDLAATRAALSQMLEALRVR